MKHQKNTPNPPDEKVLRNKVLQLLRQPKYQPLDKVELSKKLGIPSDDRSGLREVLRDMEQRGEIARIRKERYVLPQSADLVTGVIQIHAGGGAHILSETKGLKDLFIAAQNTGTAMNGDRVVARVMHEGREQRSTDKLEGRVIKILERAHDTIVGTMQKTKKFFYVIPDDPRFGHDVYVHPGEVKLPRPPSVGDKVVVKLDEWESRHVNPEGEIIEVLGPASAPGVDMLSIIRKHSLPVEFPDAVQREAERISESIHESELARREDLRHQMIVTIDPDDAKDFDDAIYVEKHADGWSLGVHIADVSHYVTPGTALDKEAYMRGNSVYLADRVIPMLPEKLSNGICSLKPDVDRLTRSAFIEFNKAGKIKSARFAHTVIRSAKRLTYKQAFAILQKPVDSPLSDRLHTAWELASLLRKNRFAAGSLDLDFPEVKVWLDASGKPVRLEKVENDISHQLIEEFMLAANEVVAYEIKKKQLPGVYRIHDNPDPDKLAEYREFIGSYGIKVGDLTQRREVQKLLASIRGKPEEYALKLGFLKSLKRAEYDTNPIGHYGLAKVNYTHFTSPIRRYADLVVHRVLSHASNHHSVKGVRLAAADLAVVSAHISDTERTAADAEKESVKLKKLEYFLNQLNQKKPDAFHAVIVDVRSYGLLVELPDILLTGMVHVSSLADDFYTFDPVRLRFVGKRKKRVYQIGDKLEVIVSRVDVYKQQVDFHPA
ncbi:MAG TPA: ribonuclease R [Chthoniobacteraceae bacterium]|nr:ribonuclease R [Chthoniobacteraceae bacterium]